MYQLCPICLKQFVKLFDFVNEIIKGVLDRDSLTTAHESQLLNFKDFCKLLVEPLKPATEGVSPPGTDKPSRSSLPSPNPRAGPQAHHWSTYKWVHRTANSHAVHPRGQRGVHEKEHYYYTQKSPLYHLWINTPSRGWKIVQIPAHTRKEQF